MKVAKLPSYFSLLSTWNDNDNDIDIDIDKDDGKMDK